MTERPQIRGLDHVVLTVASIERTIPFYTELLGMAHVRFGNGRSALGFADQKLNLHEAGREFEPKADRPTPGSADLCFELDAPVGEIARWLESNGVRVEEGPVRRTGAKGPVGSFYLRDPDRNLVELATYRIEGSR
jgi:catechol 2,3-dioxygenase-like lactoylglutathione lyase family enzyme